MKTIGILGGLSPWATLEYYRLLITMSEEKGWGNRYPEIIINSLNFEEFCQYLDGSRDQEALSLLVDGIGRLQAAGADFALIASNTPHSYLPQIRARLSVPLLSIVEETAKEAADRKFEQVGLLGTKFTMEGEFYRPPFEERGIELIVPDHEERQYINRAIFDDLTSGDPHPETIDRLVRVVERLAAQEAIDAVVLGCTELPLVLKEEDLPVPALNTTAIHARAALDRALS